VFDPLLEAFIAADGSEADRHLAVLVDRHAAPLVRAIAARRLRDYAAPGRGDADVDDAVNEAIAHLVERLRTSHATRGDDPIAAFRSYVATTTRNVCARQVRLKHPGRARLTADRRTSPGPH
jgi:DNA-directed RNA polymerase specialized sigma24 family protein